MTLNKVLLIINPVSGTLKAERSLPCILEIFSKHGVEVAVKRTEKRFDAKMFVAEAGADTDAVVCVGGDGTLNEVICGIVENNLYIPVGYIPCGTTNDFATSINIPEDIEDAVSNIIDGEPVPFDAGDFMGRNFTYIASFGAFTETSYATSQKAKNTFGHAAYIFSSIKDLFKRKDYHVRVTAAGEEYEDHYMFGAVCNTYSIGGVFRLNPRDVDMCDGIYEVVLAREAKDPFTLIKRVIDFNNRRYPSETIKYFKASEVRFESDSELEWSLDGEHAHGSRDVTVKNLHSRISLIIKNEPV